MKKAPGKPIADSTTSWQTTLPARSASPLFLTVAMAAGLLALFVVSRKWQTNVVADRWEAQLQQVEDSQVAALVQQISALDQAGLPVLVRATGSSRQMVADSARGELAALLQRWQMLDARESGPRLAILASSLAREVESFPQPARQHAVALAERLLLWPTDGGSVDRTQFVASCERVFQIAGASRTRPTVGSSIDRAGQPPIVVPAIDPLARATQVLKPAEAVGPSGPFLHSPSANLRPMTTSVDIVQLASLPGGDLPIEPVGVAALPMARDSQGDLLPASPTRRPRARLRDEPRRLYDNPLDDPARTAVPGNIPWVRDPRTAIEALEENPNDPSPAEDRPPGDTPVEPDSLREIDNTPTSSTAPRRKDYRVKQVGAVEQITGEVKQAVWFAPARELSLIRALNSDDLQSVRIATRELLALGFSDASIQAARGLTHRDPEVRQRLARSVPKMPGINARHWLLWLSQDKDPDVRLTAISLLLTTGDRLLIRQIAERSANEPDPRIRKQIDRALEVHRQ